MTEGEKLYFLECFVYELNLADHVDPSFVVSSPTFPPVTKPIVAQRIQITLGLFLQTFCSHLRTLLFFFKKRKKTNKSECHMICVSLWIAFKAEIWTVILLYWHNLKLQSWHCSLLLNFWEVQKTIKKIYI